MGPMALWCGTCSAQDHRDTRFYEPPHEVGHHHPLSGRVTGSHACAAAFHVSRRPRTACCLMSSSRSASLASSGRSSSSSRTVTSSSTSTMRSALVDPPPFRRRWTREVQSATVPPNRLPNSVQNAVTKGPKVAAPMTTSAALTCPMLMLLLPLLDSAIANPLRPSLQIDCHRTRGLAPSFPESPLGSFPCLC